jgi:ATP-dependent DNA helicase RecG
VRGGMSGSFWESYSAMANTQGGTIVLGVAEKASGLVLEGVPDAAQLRTVLWGQLNDRHKVSANLLRALVQRQATLARAFSPVPSNQVET